MDYSHEIFVSYLTASNSSAEKKLILDFLELLKRTLTENDDAKFHAVPVNLMLGGNLTNFLDGNNIGKVVVIIVNEIFLSYEACLAEIYLLTTHNFPIDKIILVYTDGIKYFSILRTIDFYYYFAEKKKYAEEKAEKTINTYLASREKETFFMYQEVEKFFVNFGSFYKTYFLAKDKNLQILINEIAANVREMFLKEKEFLLKITLPNYINQCPYFNPKNLIGRQKSLSALSELITNNKVILIDSGIPGIGKTTIAKAYINDPNYYQQYDNIAWITVSNNIFENFVDQLSKSNQLINYKPAQDFFTNFKKLYKALRRIEGNNLIIIDNANNHDELKDFLYKVRNLNWNFVILLQAAPDNMLFERLDKLSSEAAIELFYRHYKKERNDKILTFLLNLIENHTLLTELMAKVANHNENITIIKLYEIIRKAKMKPPFIIAFNDLKKFVADEFMSLERNLYRYLAEIFAIESFTDNEIKLLRYFTILPPYEIPETLLLQFFDIQQNDNSQFNFTLNNLVKKGWLQNNNESYSIHILLQPVLLKLVKPNSQNCATLINFFIKNIDYNTEDKIIKNKFFLAYAENVAYSLYDCSILLVTLIEKIGEFYLVLDNVQKCLDYSLLALNIKETLFAKDYDKIANTYTEISNLQSALGNYEQDLYYAFKTLDIRKQSPKDNKVKFAETYNNIAITYRNLKDYDKALQYHIMDIDICENIENYDSFTLAGSYCEIAITYYYLKNYEKSKLYIDKAVEIWLSKIPSENYEVINAIEIQEIITHKYNKYNK